jgi:hypothetical protein
MSDFDSYYGQALDLLNQGISPDFIKPPLFPEEFIEEIKKRLRVQTREETTSNILGYAEDQFWYRPEFFEDIYRTNYFDKLIAKEWPSSSINDINSSTTNIIQKISHPQKEEFSKCGIVVGYVQSGKTANYAALISKTIDCGYNIIIILSGIHNNLRDQTQRRIENDLHLSNPENIDSNKRITYLTSIGNQDFDNRFHPSLLLTPNPKIFIIKKNYTILSRLLAWLSEHNEQELSKFATLIIDDEADNATIDISEDYVEQNEGEDGEIADSDPSEINKHIRQIRNLFKKVCYIGYTATPFANVLIDPNDEDEIYGKNLYPKDFIISLPKPDGYSGTAELFPFISDIASYEGVPPNEHIHIVNISDHENLISGNSINYKDLIPESLRIAFYHFLITAVIKMNREVEELNHSFLIHVHHEIDTQSFIHQKFESFYELFNDQYQMSNPHDTEIIKDLENYNRYTSDLLTRLGIEDINAEQILSNTRMILQGLEILEINSQSDSELEFSNEQPTWKILIGGNRLSRGLTISGLTVTYFTRSSIYYDTLLQMGRWFGFRNGYEDLVKLFTTADNYYWFSWLNEVEESIRLDIARFENTDNVTPLDLAVRVKTHPGMHVTSPIKIKNARHVQASFDGRVSSMKKINFDVSSLENNLNQLNKFISDICLTSNNEIVKNTPVWKNVNPEQCIEFIESLSIPENDPSFPRDLIIAYIRKHINEHQELHNWSIVLSNKDSAVNRININDIEIGLVNRSKHKNLDALVMLEDFKDYSLDLGTDQTPYTNLNAIRNARQPSNPILVIYVIDKDSETWKNNENAHSPFFENEAEARHIVAVSILLPLSPNAERNDYIVTAGVDSDVGR